MYSIAHAGCINTSEQGVAPEAVAEAYHNYEQGGKVAPLRAAAMSNQGIQESMRLLLLVRAYQVRVPLLCVNNAADKHAYVHWLHVLTQWHAGQWTLHCRPGPAAPGQASNAR